MRWFLLAVACFAAMTVVWAFAKSPESTPNVLLARWTGPYGGVPAFDKMNLASAKPALEAGMAKHLEELDAIAKNAAPPTFENTLVAMERAGRDLDRVMVYWDLWGENLSTPAFREIQEAMAPRLADHRSKIRQNAALFARIKAVHEGKEALRPDQRRLVWLVHNSFTRDGATLEGDAKQRYAAINQRLAELHTKFGNNVLADEEGYVTYLNKDQLGGLPESFVRSAAAAAEERKHSGSWAVTNTRSSMDPFLTYSTDRA